MNGRVGAQFRMRGRLGPEQRRHQVVDRAGIRMGGEVLLPAAGNGGIPLDIPVVLVDADEFELRTILALDVHRVDLLGLDRRQFFHQHIGRGRIPLAVEREYEQHHPHDEDDAEENGRQSEVHGRETPEIVFGCQLSVFSCQLSVVSKSHSNAAGNTFRLILN